MELILVGIGGIFGSITRFALGRLISEHSKPSFPYGTFLINVTGAFLLGVAVSFQNYQNIYLIFGDGFLGAYTTFSTFMYEGFNLFQGKEKLKAFSYIFGSLLLGVLGFAAGLKTGQILHLI